jgi:outer membrane receptor protein involved in Fe transport
MKVFIAVTLLLATTAAEAAQVSDVEVPTIVQDTTEGPGIKVDDQALDLANIVQSAAKNVTTIQEAPAIVTVVTADDIRERQFQDLPQLTDTVPGWQRIGLTNSFFPTSIVRGQVFAVQFLQDGLSMFDPMTNVPTINRQQPMELIKRVEMITGPGGVLWGSNSLLGILNIITKDAEDVDGVEVGSGIGNGKGDRLAARAYVMAGKVVNSKLKVFGHGSVDTYQGAGLDMPLILFHNPIPQPNSPNTYGPLTETDQKQTLIVNLDGKVTYGALTLRASLPFGRIFRPVGVSGNPSVANLPEDERCKNNGVVDKTCVDNLRTGREASWDSWDRYVSAEHKSRFANGKAGVTLRAYGIQFKRGLAPLNVIAPSSTIPGGLTTHVDLSSYRVGGALDGDAELARPLRVLYGAEAFNEWLPDDHGESRQGAGLSSTFDGPSNLNLLPLPCPRIYDESSMSYVPVPHCPLTSAFATRRTVFGAYVAPQLRPNKKLIVDGGGRVQVAPEQLGNLSYPVTFTASGTLVWNFIPNWHAKLNYAQGFRPPVFNNTSANGEAVEVGGDPKLKVETSDAFQAEVNARIFKSERTIRELSFRLDASYTRLNGLIQVAGGRYANSGDRGVSSAEFLGKLYIQGGHRLELAYTWMRVATEDRGLIKALPEHWLNFATVFNLITNKLTATTNIKIMGAIEDPDRLVEYRDTSYDANGYPMNPVTVNPTDVVLDRLPPIAELSAGLSWTPLRNMLVRATVYNALFQHSYQPDVFFDYEPHVEFVPMPYEGFRAYLSLMYQYQ